MLAVPLPDVAHTDTTVRLRQVADLAQRMRVALGTACGTLYKGDEGLDNTLTQRGQYNVLFVLPWSMDRKFDVIRALNCVYNAIA